MGVADFAFSHSVSFRRRQAAGEHTEIVLEAKGPLVVAKNKLGHELYQLKAEGNGEYSMRDNHGHSVLRTRRDPEKANQFSLVDKEGQVIGHTASGHSFQWEAVSITWTAKSIGLISDALMVAHESPESPNSGSNPDDELQLAEFKMAHAKTPGYLKVPAEVIASQALPPLGLFLFEAMVFNQDYLRSSTLQRLSMTSRFF